MIYKDFLLIFWLVASSNFFCYSIKGDEKNIEKPIKLLTSFEKEQLLEWKCIEGKNGIFTFGTSSYCTVGPIKKGDASNGEWAISRDYSKNYYEKGDTNYNILRRNSLLNTYGWSKKYIPLDWSDYDKLRIDFKSTSSSGTVLVEIEDSICTPLLRREYNFPAGKWVTLEFNLSDASKIRSFKDPLGKETKYRLINFSQMANIYVWPIQMNKDTTLLLDNIRLVKKDTKEENELFIITDEKPFTEVEYLQKNSTILEKSPVIAIANIPEKVVISTIDFKNEPKGSYDRVGFLTDRAVVAVTPNRLLLGYLQGYLHVLQTKNSGVNWFGINNEIKGTKAYHSANAPSHVAASAGSDLLYVFQDYCSGGANPTNMFFKIIKYENENWVMHPPYLVDVSCRHCPEGQVKTLRQASGRLWSTWMHQSRWSDTYVRAKYSNDEGHTWQDPDSNALIKMNQDNSQGLQQMGVTVWLEDKSQMIATDRANGFIMKKAQHGALQITPFKENILCIAEVDWKDTIQFSIFDNKSWSSPETITYGSLGSTVTLGSTDVFSIIKTAKDGNKIWHFKNNKWIEETPLWLKESKQVILSANSKTLWVIWNQQEKNIVTTYYSYQRINEQWATPILLDTNTLDNSNDKIGLQAPAEAPEQFLPVAWGPKFDWIKTTVIPLKPND